MRFGFMLEAVEMVKKVRLDFVRASVIFSIICELKLVVDVFGGILLLVGHETLHSVKFENEQLIVIVYSIF